MADTKNTSGWGSIDPWDDPERRYISNTSPNTVKDWKTVFAGNDLLPFLIVDNHLYEIDNLNVLSISVHRDKFPVRRLGRSYPVGYTRGGRTIAGSMVFINFDRGALYDIVSSIENNDYQNYALADQLPPLDFFIIGITENARVSYIELKGVEFVDEGIVMGQSEAYPETTMQYVARDYKYLTPLELENYEFQNKELEIKFNNILKALQELDYQKTVRNIPGDPLTIDLSKSKV